MSEKNSHLTIYDISQRSGVSIATVSRVLNGYSNVSEKTRKKVLEVIDSMGYKPNAFARGLGLDTMKTIGILCADSSDPYLAKAVYYIEEDLRKSQYNSLLCCTGHMFEDKHNSLDLLLSKKVDAAILVGSHFLDSSSQGNKYIKTAADSIPVMLLNASLEYPNVYSLYCDDRTAMESTVNFLFEKGRKNILYLYNSKTFSGLKKMDGFKHAFETRGLVLEKEYLHYFPGTRDDLTACAKSLETLYKEGLKFDAVVASEDYLAVAALKFAIKNKINVPKDLSIIGYNNSTLALLTEPEITSVDNKLEALSHQLVTTLLGVLEGKEMPKRTEYSGVLVERGTT